MAEEMGLLGEASDPGQTQEERPTCVATDSELLAQAVGAPTAEHQSNCRSDDRQKEDQKRPTWVATSTSSLAKLPADFQPAQASWSNSRLRFNPQSRLASKAQRKELFRRDGWKCSTPGCSHGVWLHLHHLKSYAEGGETSAVNLCSLCSICHANLHSGALQIQEQSDGTLLFLDAEGRRLDRRCNIEVAGWLDWWHGWEGREEDSHGARLQQGLWAVAM